MWKHVALLVAALFLGSHAQAQTLLDVHGKAGVACAACHSEQPASAAPPDSVCVACHGTMIGDDGKQASSPDPHRSPHLGPDEVPACNECHSIHGQSEVTCVACHRGFQFDTR